MEERQNAGKLAALKHLLHIEKVGQAPIHTSVPDYPEYRSTKPMANSFEEVFTGTGISSQRVICLMNDLNFMEYARWRNIQQDRLLEMVAQGKQDPHSLVPENWQNESARIRERLVQSGWTNKEMLAGLIVARGTVRKPEVPQV